MAKKSAVVAAFLSFVFPGLGHLYLGQRRQAVVFALPALLIAAVIGAQVFSGPDSVLAFVITPSGSMTVLLLFLLSGAWRIAAMVDAVLQARRGSGLGVPGAVAISTMLAVVLATHGAAAYVSYSVYDAGSKMFVEAGPDDGSDSPGPPGTQVAAGSQGPTSSNHGSPSPDPSDDDYQVAPEATPETASSRINILLTGIDSAETRTTSLTDTIMVVSVNPADRSVVMLSIPRDISKFPLYDGRTYDGKINSFMTWVRNHPKQFKEKPFPALMKEVGYLVGVPIHYFAAIDLQGFRRMVDAVGGVTVDNQQAISDPRYDWLDGTFGFFLDAGKVKLNGRTALAYARSRQGVGDSDFTRAARQQQLLVALRGKLTSPEMITRLPDIIEAAGDTVRTNLPTSRFEEFIGLAREVDTDAIERVVLTYPIAFHPDTASTGGVWTLQLHMNKVAALSKRLFGEDSRYADN